MGDLRMSQSLNNLYEEYTNKWTAHVRCKQAALVERLTREYGTDRSKWPHARELRERDEKEKHKWLNQHGS